MEARRERDPGDGWSGGFSGMKMKGVFLDDVLPSLNFPDPVSMALDDVVVCDSSNILICVMLCWAHLLHSGVVVHYASDRKPRTQYDVKSMLNTFTGYLTVT